MGRRKITSSVWLFNPLVLAEYGTDTFGARQAGNAVARVVGVVLDQATRMTVWPLLTCSSDSISRTG